MVVPTGPSCGSRTCNRGIRSSCRKGLKPRPHNLPYGKAWRALSAVSHSRPPALRSSDVNERNWDDWDSTSLDHCFARLCLIFHERDYMNQVDHAQHADDVTLLDYWRVIWKRRRLVGGLF